MCRIIHAFKKYACFVSRKVLVGFKCSQRNHENSCNYKKYWRCKLKLSVFIQCYWPENFITLQRVPKTQMYFHKKCATFELMVVTNQLSNQTFNSGQNQRGPTWLHWMHFPERLCGPSQLCWASIPSTPAILLFFHYLKQAEQLIWSLE